MKKNIQKINDWDAAGIKALPFNLIKVLALFIKRNKLFLDSTEIKDALKFKDKQVGGIMASFQKTAKGRSPLVFPIFRVGRGFRWVINEKELPIVKKVISEFKKYLNNGGMDT